VIQFKVSLFIVASIGRDLGKPRKRLQDRRSVSRFEPGTHRIRKTSVNLIHVFVNHILLFSSSLFLSFSSFFVFACCCISLGEPLLPVTLYITYCYTQHRNMRIKIRVLSTIWIHNPNMQAAKTTALDCAATDRSPCSSHIMRCQ
jgi:hypothetical protein